MFQYSRFLLGHLLYVYSLKQWLLDDKKLQFSTLCLVVSQLTKESGATQIQDSKFGKLYVKLKQSINHPTSQLQESLSSSLLRSRRSTSATSIISLTILDAPCCHNLLQISQVSSLKFNLHIREVGVINQLTQIQQVGQQHLLSFKWSICNAITLSSAVIFINQGALHHLCYAHARIKEITRALISSQQFDGLLSLTSSPAPLFHRSWRLYRC